MLVKK